MSDINVENHEKEAAKIARGERLAQVRGMANIKRSELEKQYGLSAQTLKGWELGRFTGLTEQGARRVLTVLKQLGVQCSIAWLMDGIGKPPSLVDKTSSLPPTKETKLSGTSRNVIDTAPPQEIKLFFETHPNAIYMQVIDDGMEPHYFEGDYVAGERYYQEDISQHALGKYCIVETQMGEILLRRVREGSKEGYYSLQCINEKTIHPTPYLYDVELLSAAPIMLHSCSPNSAAKYDPSNT